mgnify:CR=1 FL=1
MHVGTKFRIIYSYSYPVGAYDGAMNEQGQRHGYGVMKYTNGDVYEGMWETDKKHGLGKQIHRNGDIYEGEFVHGRKHGKGK